MKKASLAVVAAFVMLLAGCSAEREPATGPVADTSAPVPERLTLEVAARAFRTFVTNDDVARASGDERLALNWVSDGQSQLVAAEYRKAAFRGDAVARYLYDTPSLHIPKLGAETYPQWFVAAVDRDVRPTAAADVPPDPKERRTALLAFIRRAPAAPWTLSLAMLQERRAKAPKIAIDAEGYATPLVGSDTSVLIQPDTVAGIQATIAEEGPAIVAARLMRAGPYTTGYFARTQRLKKAAKDDGLAYEPIFTATQYPFFALRTVDGGALVMYALATDAVTIVRDEETKLSVPQNAAHLLSSLFLGHEVRVMQTLQFGVYDPAKPPAGKKPQPRADVIAFDGAVTKAISPRQKVP